VTVVAKTRAEAGCRFCATQGRPLTREHVLAQWVRPLLEDGPSAPYVRETEDRGVERVWNMPLAGLTVKRVCAACNGGWMNDLETGVQPILRGMIASTLGELTAAAQRTLTAWGTKTAMAYDLTLKEPVLPDECRRWLVDHGTPPEGTVMLLARYGGRRFPLYASHGTRKFQVQVGDQPTRDWRAFLLTVSVGPVVLQLFGHGIANVVDLRPRGWKQDFAHVIWPDPAPLPWPLPRALGDDGLRRFGREV
jgi:hypothetical protein